VIHTLLKGSEVTQENMIKVFEMLKGRPITAEERAEYLAHIGEQNQRSDRARRAGRPGRRPSAASQTSAGVRYSRELRAAYDYLRGRVMAEAGPLEISGLRA